jgi:hypothetical protein
MYLCELDRDDLDNLYVTRENFAQDSGFSTFICATCDIQHRQRNYRVEQYSS